MLPQLVRGMIDLLQRTFGKGVEIETHFPLFLKHVFADENHVLELALLNLCVNARDAMPGRWRDQHRRPRGKISARSARPAFPPVLMCACP